MEVDILRVRIWSNRPLLATLPGGGEGDPGRGVGMENVDSGPQMKACDDEKQQLLELTLTTKAGYNDLPIGPVPLLILLYVSNNLKTLNP